MFGKKVRVVFLVELMLTVMLCGMTSTKTYADNSVISEETISEGITDAYEEEILEKVNSINDFIWPDSSGQYHYTEKNLTSGKSYMLVVTQGILDEVSADKDEIVKNAIYMDEKTITSDTASFAFIPAIEANATVIFAGMDKDPKIVGYISNDMVGVTGYTITENGTSEISDISVPNGTAYADVVKLLPREAYAIISSELTADFREKVQLTWRENSEYSKDAENASYTFIADVTPKGEFLADKPSLLPPFSIKVNTFDQKTCILYISAIKDKVRYSVGDTINTDDIVVKAVYDNNIITDINASDCEFSNVDTSKEGIQTLTISYTDSQYGIVFKANIMIEITSDAAASKYAVVSFNSKGGSLVAKELVLKGELLVLPEEPVKAGVVFDGWYTDSLYKTKFNESEPINSDITLYAKWAEEKEPEVVLSSIEAKADKYKYDFSIWSDKEKADEWIKAEKITVKAFYSDGTSKEVTDFTTNLDKIDHNIPGEVNVIVSYTENGVTATDEFLLFINDAEDNSYFILRKDGTNSHVESPEKYVYTGKAIKPSFIIYDEAGNRLTEKKDYKITYTNNVNASTETKKASATVEGAGTYEGKIVIDYVIEPKVLELPEASIDALAGNAYSDKGYTPAPSVAVNKKKLKKNTDYSISYYTANSNGVISSESPVTAPLKTVGHYKVVVTGKGNYSGELSTDYEIGNKNAKSISKLSITLTKSKFDYSGSDVVISPTFKDGGKRVYPSYRIVYPNDNVNPGKKVAVISITSDSKYYGSVNVKYEITGLEVKGTTVEFANSKVTYDGTNQKSNLKSVGLKITSKNRAIINGYTGGQYAVNEVYKLKENKDYTVQFANTYKAGKATVTITGKGLFTGTVNKTFSINKADISKVGTASFKDTELDIPAYYQDKGGVVPDLEVVAFNSNLIATKDYTLKFNKNAQAGTAKVTISGTGNYSGKIEKSFKIIPKSFASSDIKIVVANAEKLPNKNSTYVYKPKVYVYDNGTLLKSGKDYTVSYGKCAIQSAVLSGDDYGFITIMAKDKSYFGSRGTYYKVTDLSIASNTCTAKINDQRYNGGKIVFDLSKASDREQFDVKMNGQTLKAGEDFTIVEYSKNDKVGVAKVTIAGRGKYSGTKVITFNITKRKM